MLKIKLSLLIFILLFSYNAAARYAALVMNVDTGQVLYENEAAQRWYPASLTKVMTLYMTFAALESGKLNLHDELITTRHAAMQPKSHLGLRVGEHITVEQAILSITTHSANDAAVLLAETLGDTESHFAAMMTNQAHKLGMSSSSFVNASGLPDENQISSAKDLAILSAALIHDFPEYYTYFSVTEFSYKGRLFANTNRILRNYPDADGLKTGFTCGSGFNLIASAKRNGQRVVGVLLGGHSSMERFQQMGNLLDIGFEKLNHADSIGHISSLKDDDYAPPPFQLSSNRCAGSAVQMGADAGSESHEPIRIRPAVAHERDFFNTPPVKLKKAVLKTKPNPQKTTQPVKFSTVPALYRAPVPQLHKAVAPKAKAAKPLPVVHKTVSPQKSQKPSFTKKPVNNAVVARH